MNIFHRLTLRILKKNPMRTVVTVIGIILSMTLFTAVLEGAWSGLVFARDVEEHLSGRYHGIVQNISQTVAEKIKKIEDISETDEIKEVGYAVVNTDSETNPYLYILSVDKNESLVPIKITSGRMPQNNRELVISVNAVNSRNKDYQKIEIGDELSLAVGNRSLNGKKPYNGEIYSSDEKLTDVTERKYTVVGICERPTSDLVSYSLPGFIAITSGDRGNGIENVAFTVKNPYFYNSIIKKNPVLHDAVTHSYLLKFYGNMDDSGMKYVVVGLVSVLLAMILIGSVSLIYNSFAISISERTRQYGMLRSLGATKRQIRSSVYYEAFILSVIGIPIGLIIGCVGIGATIHGLSGTFDMFANGTGCHIHLALNPAVILSAILLCLLMTLISAAKPARKAVRISPIEAIRQTDDVKMDKGGRKAGEKEWQSGHFFSAMAKKNFYRNKKRSMATVFSIFLSVVLFVSASSFVDGIGKEVDNAVNSGSSADVVGAFSYQPYSDAPIKLWKKYKDNNEVTDAVMNVDFDMPGEHFYVSDDKLEDDYKANEFRDHKNYFYSQIRFIDDDSFRRMCKENGLSAEKFMNRNSPLGLMYNSQTFTDSSGRSVKTGVINNDEFPVSVSVRNYDQDEKEADEYNEKPYSTEITIGAEIKGKPWFEGANARIYYPMSLLDDVYGFDVKKQTIEENQNVNYELDFRTTDHEELTAQIRDDIGASNMEGDVIDHEQETITTRMLIYATKVFVYGFIILISIISAVNVFNMIYTGVILRKRELAMLESVGMSGRGIREMLKKESMQYGTKALMAGIPVSFVISLLIWYIIRMNIVMSYYPPVIPMVIAIVAVFVVIFLSMYFAEKRIGAENLMDAMKDENV